MARGYRGVGGGESTAGQVPWEREKCVDLLSAIGPLLRAAGEGLGRGPAPVSLDASGGDPKSER